MPVRTQPTAFVTGAAGFIGTELLNMLVTRGHRVFGLAPSLEAARRVRDAGAIAVMGNPLQPGAWQEEVAADWVFHLPPHWACESRRSADSFARERVAMDSHVLDAATHSIRRIVYVGDTSCYGAVGERAVTEDEPPRPSSWGRYVTPALDSVEGYVIAGLPIITAFAGWVYGDGSWFRERIIDPVLAGRRVLLFGEQGAWVSPIHVRDCARALVHLAERGVVGGRYFLVNSQPIRLHEFASVFARIAERPLRLWRVPAAATRLFVGSVLADYIHADAVFSNIRLRGIGFQFRYPTLEQGVRQILGELDE